MADPYAGISTLARKYGFPPNHPQIQAEKKSGFTPILPPSIIPPGPRDAAYEFIQRDSLLYGFTARELEEYGCYPDPNAQLRILTNDIHECLRQDRWEGLLTQVPDKSLLPVKGSGPGFDLGNNPGLWCAENPLVWAILDPVLRLVSRFLDDIHTNEFYDAFLFGQFMRVSRFIKDHKQYEFRIRDPSRRNYDENKKKIRDLLSKSRCKLSFHDPAVPHPDFGASGAWHGFTWSGTKDPLQIHLTLSIRQYKPLLRNDLSASERMCNQFFCAATILHELAHVMEVAQGGWSRRLFFQNQIFSEMGFAASMAIFGGNTETFVRDRNGGSAIGVNLNDGEVRSWPTLGGWIMSHPMAHSRNVNQAYRAGSVMPTIDTYRPIPAHYYEYIHQDEFWDFALKRFGSESIKPMASIQSLYGSPTIKSPQAIHQGTRWYDDQKVTKPYTVQELAAMLPEDRKTIALAESTRKSAERTPERARFRNGRSNFVSSVRQTSNIIHFVRKERPQFIAKIKDLLKIMATELDRQAQEIALFVFNNDKDKLHHTFLRELNHYMRNMVKEFKTKYADNTGDQDVMNQMSEIMDVANTCIVMLNDEDEGQAIDSDDYFQMAKRRVNLALIQRLEVSPPQIVAAKMDDSFIPGLLQQARDAIAIKDRDRCKFLGDTFITNFSSKTFFAAVGKILLAHDGSIENPILHRSLSGEEEMAMIANSDVSNEIREQWVAIRRLREAEIQAEDIAQHNTRIAAATRTTLSTKQPKRRRVEARATARSRAAAMRGRRQFGLRLAMADADEAELEAREDGADEREIRARKRAAFKEGIHAHQNAESFHEGDEKRAKAAKLKAEAQVQQQEGDQPLAQPGSEPGNWCPHNADDGGWSEALANKLFMEKFR